MIIYRVKQYDDDVNEIYFNRHMRVKYADEDTFEDAVKKIKYRLERYPTDNYAVYEHKFTSEDNYKKDRAFAINLRWATWF